MAALAWPGQTAAAQKVTADPLTRDAEFREAMQRFYVQDYDAALARFEKIEQQHSSDPLAVALVLHAVLFKEFYRLDLLDTTFYANDGFLTGRHPVPEDPHARDQIAALTDRVVSLADERLRANGHDEGALFARAWARSMKAAYLAMVERSFGAAFHLATQARSDGDHLLQMDPGYADAKLIVGIYQYVVGALPFPFKIMIGFAGITGSKAHGMGMLRDAARDGTITPVEAKTVIALFLRREGKYSEAIAVIRELKGEYPRGSLFCLEEANLLKDSGDGPAAISAYRAVLAQKPGYFATPHHPELAWFGLGDSLRGQNQLAEAAAAYEHAAFQPATGAELKRCSLVDAGQAYDLMKQRDRAERSYRAAIAAGPDSTQADLARKYMRSPYTGR